MSSVALQLGEGGYAFVYLVREVPTAHSSLVEPDVYALKKVLIAELPVHAIIMLVFVCMLLASSTPVITQPLEQSMQLLPPYRIGPNQSLLFVLCALCVEFLQQ